MPVHPFDHQRPAAGAAFVDRETELSELRRRLDNGVNTLLIGHRRLGKSSLILRAFHDLPAERFRTLYVDVMKAADEEEVAERIANAMARASFGTRKRAWLAFLDYLQRLRPSFEVDAAGPRIRLDPAEPGPRSIGTVLEVLEEVAKEQDVLVALALDEFQALAQAPDADRLLAGMRGVVQHQERVRYVLSGSRTTVLRELVADHDSPFWQQLDVLEVGGLGPEHFDDRIQAHFRDRGRAFPKEAVDALAAWCEDNPKRIMETLHHLYERDADVDAALVAEVVEGIVAAQHHHFGELLAQVKAGNQRRVLVALAREPDAAPYASGFVRRHRLKSSAHVQRAVQALERVGILDGDHRFLDPFFRHYLADGSGP